MASIDWLKDTFRDGYDSGDILAVTPDPRRVHEEALIGGSYKECFQLAALPFLRPDSAVLEFGPGRGSWTKALLAYVPEGRVETVDFLDVTSWLLPERYGGRLVCHQVESMDLDCVQDESFDFIWSFGVLVHLNSSQIAEVLSAARRKVRRGGVSVHNYGNWQKLYRTGRIMSHDPDLHLKDTADSWWPPNSPDAMAAIALDAGWTVIQADMELFERDGMILLKAW